MSKLIKALGLILITGVIALGCESITDSQIDNIEKKNQVLALEADNAADNKTVGSEAKSLGNVTLNTEVSS
ncbi:hypothetical protein [Rhodohalobacter sp. 8-1]|uniref:hypothetical protein n=1 Tax=Rhodohalobacter sp. 8-1 TaxID=3131972 RepID=UPI0030EDE4FB